MSYLVIAKKNEQSPMYLCMNYFRKAIFAFIIFKEKKKDFFFWFWETRISDCRDAVCCSLGVLCNVTPWYHNWNKGTWVLQNNTVESKKHEICHLMTKRNIFTSRCVWFSLSRTSKYIRKQQWHQRANLHRLKVILHGKIRIDDY